MDKHGYDMIKHCISNYFRVNKHQLLKATNLAVSSMHPPVNKSPFAGLSPYPTKASGR